MYLKLGILAFAGLGAGAVIAAGIFAFLAIIGVFPRLIGVTHTAEHVILYETLLILGGTWGNLQRGVSVPWKVCARSVWDGCRNFRGMPCDVFGGNAKGTADPEPPDRAGGGAAVCDPGGGCGKGIWIGSVFSAGIRMIYLSGSLISD